jgi:hypothetical protein
VKVEFIAQRRGIRIKRRCRQPGGNSMTGFLLGTMTSLSGLEAVIWFCTTPVLVVPKASIL